MTLSRQKSIIPEGDIGSDAPDILQIILRTLREGGKLWLFLDYDGTLVPYAPRPEQARPDPALLELLAELAHAPEIRTVMLSGRPLDFLDETIAVPGVTLAGLYGVEVRMPDQRVVRRADAQAVRRVIDQVKKNWSELVQGRPGFIIEDKGMAVALHGHLADANLAAEITPRAQALALEAAAGEFRILGGEFFVEVAPSSAHKGKTVDWLLSSSDWQALPVYFGDDDKDEEAFAAILDHGGIPIIVGSREPETQALARLPSPADARQWLKQILAAASESANE